MTATLLDQVHALAARIETLEAANKLLQLQVADLVKDNRNLWAIIADEDGIEHRIDSNRFVTDLLLGSVAGLKQRMGWIDGMEE